MDVRSGSVEVEAGRIAFDRAGEGFPVVLVHPGLWDRRIWDRQFEAFAAHHDVVRYDLRGYGGSDMPTEPYSDVRDLRRLMLELEVERCAIVGCSMGGQIAVNFALEHPDVAEALVLVSPGLSGYEWGDARLDVVAAEVHAAVAIGDLVGAMEAELAMWTPVDLDPDTSRWIRDVAMDNVRILEIPETLPEALPPVVGRLGDLEAATLVVVGEKDVEEIHAIAELLLERVPGALKREIHDADHLVMVRQPEAFNRVVLDFLSFRM
jgi:pimeloyl-ACP methyl ester carboxylesterase